MRRNIISSWPLIVALFIASAFIPLPALAWTSADLEKVDVELELSADGPSRVVTRARYNVVGGRFHGFDLAPLADAELMEEDCLASLDDGRQLPLSFTSRRGGRTRVALGGGAEVKQGAVTFTLVHFVDLVGQGALRRYSGRARLDWTPIVWDEGTNAMTVRVVLPGAPPDLPTVVDRDVAQDYEVQLDETSVSLIKYRPVRWYPMRVVLDLDPALAPDLLPQESRAREPDADAPQLAAVTLPTLPPPWHMAALPAVAALLGLLALMLKVVHLRRVLRQVGLAPRYRLLARTGFLPRLVLSLAAVSLGLAVQQAGHLAAGVPALVAAAALWMVRRSPGGLRPRAGGTWREMSDGDRLAYLRLTRDYHRSRRSIVDVTTLRGGVAFALMLAGIGYLALLARGEWPTLAWAMVIDALILTVPAWFANVRAELPVDPTLEGFCALRRWRRALSRLAGARCPGAEASFWVREDADGPIEIRLRVELPLPGLRGIEVAGEVLRSGSLHRACPAVIMRLEPGTEATRQLATCPNAAEHHLTPDLEEEVIVLRNRRGSRNTGLAPLRAALALLPS